MALPFSFLIGLLVVVAHREMGGALPGEATVSNFLWFASLLLVPWLLAALARTSAVRALLGNRPPAAPPRALLRLSGLATPMVLHALFEFGVYNDCIDRLAPGSHTLRILLALLPLYLAELPRTAMATMAEGLVEVGFHARAGGVVTAQLLPRWSEVWPVIRLRLGWPILTLLPAAMLGGCLDLLQLHRESYVFVLATSAGMTLATIAFMILASTILPFWFRVSFGARRGLPEPIGQVLRETAVTLGFSPRRIFLLPTGMRAMNAMMVGPLPVGRLLCLTDGLLATLDIRSLTGVLAHEIGHARRGHPGLLMLLAVVVPLMLLSPLRLLEVEQVDVVVQAIALLVVMLLLWFGIRTLARRFEHEADVSSVRALGAGPCSSALMTVSRLTGGPNRSVRGRLLSLHPDESARLLLMRRYEIEPKFREDFDRRSHRLRGGIGAVLLVAMAVGVWFWQVDWPYERALVRFHSGDYVGAREAMAALDERPARWRDSLKRLDEELAAGLELAPDARNWSTIEQKLVPSAWQRGEAVLLAQGPEAASRWFSLAVGAMPAPTPTEYAIYEFCQAASDGDSNRMAKLAHIIKRRGVPSSLRQVFRDYE